MSDTVDESMATPADEPARLPLGAVLSAARARHKLSIDDISSHLRLSRRQVLALENDDFSALPEAMITRGYIRNYARLLEVDAEPLLQAYRDYAPSANNYAISIHSANIPMTTNKRSWKMYFVASLVIALLLGLWVMYMDYLPKLKQQSLLPVPGATVEQPVSTPLPQSSLPAMPMVVTENPGSSQPTDTEPAAIDSTAEPLAGTAATTEADQADAASATSTIRLTFTDTSWVSVVDANNNEILNTTKTAGSEEVVQGQPPFKVKIGNAAGSKLSYNDEPIDLAPYTELNVTRITLE